MLATTTGFLLPDFWLLSPEDDLPVFSLADLITDVEDLGIDTATSSLKRVVTDLRVVAVRPDGAIAERGRVASSSRTTASSFSPIELDFVALDDAGETVTSFENLSPELEVEPELDFFSMGGGRTGALDSRFSFRFELPFVPAESGLVGVGVTEVATSSLELGERSDSVGEVGDCEAEVEAGVRERAAL